VLKSNEKLAQKLAKLECKLLDVQKIKKDVEIVLGLPHQRKQKKKNQDFGPTIASSLRLLKLAN
jgi:hypothetical protein